MEQEYVNGKVKNGRRGRWQSLGKSWKGLVLLMMGTSFVLTLLLLNIERNDLEIHQDIIQDAIFPDGNLHVVRVHSRDQQGPRVVENEVDEQGLADDLVDIEDTNEIAEAKMYRKNINYTKVAIFADATLNKATKRVLELVREEGADMVLHAGDLDYTGKVEAFSKQFQGILGQDFPYLFSAGNYENKPSKEGTKKSNKWKGYVNFRKNLFESIGVKCSHMTADETQVACHFKGVSFVLSNLSNLKSKLQSDSLFIKEGLDRLDMDFPNTRWKICAFHAPFYTMQVGFRPPPGVMKSKFVEDAYEYCREAGAIIVTGHEHYYIRTHLMKTFRQPYQYTTPESNATITADNVIKSWRKRLRGPTGQPLSDLTDLDASIPTLEVGPGSTFALVSGLGGHSVSVPSLQHFLERKHLTVCHPHHMLSNKDPGGKVIFPEVNGNPETSSSLIKREVDEHGLPFGALFCQLPLTPNRGTTAYCYFKTIDGKVADEFYYT